MMTIKEYAEKRGKSVQAVYKQIQAKDNAKNLEGHITKEKRGNRWARILDDTAIAVLDEASKQSPTVIVDESKDDRIAELEKKVDALMGEVLKRDERITDLTDSVLKLTENVLLLTTSKPSGIVESFKRLFGRKENNFEKSE